MCQPQKQLGICLIFYFSNAFMFKIYIVNIDIFLQMNIKKKKYYVLDVTEIFFICQLHHKTVYILSGGFWGQKVENQIKTQFFNFILRRQKISHFQICVKVKKFVLTSLNNFSQFQKNTFFTNNRQRILLIKKDFDLLINLVFLSQKKRKQFHQYNLQNQTTSMQNYNIPSQPMFCYYPMQIYNPYFFYPQQIVVQTQPQINEQEISNQNCFNIIKKQNLEETKPPEAQDSHNFDFDIDDQDDKDEDYKVMCSNENSDRNNIVNQLKGSTNLQKNYARAVILYIKQQNSSIVKELGQKKATYFFRFITKIQNKIRNLSHINNYTRDEEFIRLFRMLCNKFLRKDCVSYIYNSKIKQKTSHLKGKHAINKNLFKI
ncbi:unnamed protein product (macronuclear) [Paramecium tetraurelia]|uniref:Transmembrane protein n=1 Tax=Paramecium tetraurelia TaxID=5888 RepID=A0CV64_PARTE|nr:uncharacterized protein GSPATT00010849001 [Paramecium tetraurelia]CAK74681.1 unnamed protein product [Paramecium tetraurelia]|eukprot:XP_001442078.1 hypothetical protein (macronuclear) [Paramecium tetraurelia strain d4-2]